MQADRPQRAIDSKSGNDDSRDFNHFDYLGGARMTQFRQMTGLFLALIIGGMVLALWPRIVAVAAVLVDTLGVLAIGLGYTIAVVIGLGSVAWLAYFIRGLQYNHAHKKELQKIEADRLRAEAAQAATVITTVKRGDDIIISNLLGQTNALHTIPQLAMASHVNGQPTEPTPEQLNRWLMRQSILTQSARNAGAIAAPVVEAQATPPLLIPTMLGFDRVLLVGGTGTGKTNILKHYIKALADSGAKIRVIDPHSPSRLCGVDVIGSGLNWGEIETYFLTIMATVQRRYKSGQIAQDGDLGGSSH